MRGTFVLVAVSVEDTDVLTVVPDELVQHLLEGVELLGVAEVPVVVDVEQGLEGVLLVVGQDLALGVHLRVAQGNCDQHCYDQAGLQGHTCLDLPHYK